MRTDGLKLTYIIYTSPGFWTFLCVAFIIFKCVNGENSGKEAVNSSYVVDMTCLNEHYQMSFTLKPY